MTNMWTTQQKIQNVNEEHGLTDNRRVDVQNLVSKRRRGWGLSKRGHLNATRSTLQKPVTGWMEALAITVHLTRKYFFRLNKSLHLL